MPPVEELLEEELLEDELLDELLEDELLEDELLDELLEDEPVLGPPPPQPTIEADNRAIPTAKRVFCIIIPPKKRVKTKGDQGRLPIYPCLIARVCPHSSGAAEFYFKYSVIHAGWR